MPDQSITLIGNLPRDPELRYTSAGQAVTSFSIAVSNRWQDRKTEEWREDTAWVDITAWATLAENAAASLVKGTRVVVTGRLKQDSWEDKATGAKRSKLVVTADEIAPSLKWATAKVEPIEREKAER